MNKIMIGPGVGDINIANDAYTIHYINAYMEINDNFRRNEKPVICI